MQTFNFCFRSTPPMPSSVVAAQKPLFKRTRLLAFLVLACAGFAQAAQAQTGISFSIEPNPLNKWGRWTVSDPVQNNYTLRTGPERNRIPMIVDWQEGDWVFKLHKDAPMGGHDLFFGLRLAQSPSQTTSVGCSGNTRQNSLSQTQCGFRLDLNLK